MRQPFPYRENGLDYGPGGVCRGALMGRTGTDPRAKWPHGVLTLDHARADVFEAAAWVARFPDDTAPLSEACARLEAVENPYAGRLTLRQVPVDAGGYDPGGAYWGHGNVWCAWSPCRSIVAYVDAGSAREAAAKVREEYPAARVVHLGEGMS